MSFVDRAGGGALQRLHAATALAPGDDWPPLWRGSADALALLRVEGGRLVVGAFRIERWGQVFLSAAVLRVGLGTLPRERLRIVAVHDFRSEDHDADLGRARAGVFLARRAGLGWEAPEDEPLECRALAVLGELDVASACLASPA